MCPNTCDKTSKFCFKKGGHDVTGYLEVGGHHVMREKASTTNPWWSKNTWTDHLDLRMSEGELSQQMVRWVDG
jgi:hypothetical protein